MISTVSFGQSNRCGERLSLINSDTEMSTKQTDQYLDLLFFHRSMRRLVAIELKLHRFQPEHKGQMECGICAGLIKTNVNRVKKKQLALFFVQINAKQGEPNLGTTILISYYEPCSAVY